MALINYKSHVRHSALRPSFGLMPPKKYHIPLSKSKVSRAKNHHESKLNVSNTFLNLWTKKKMSKSQNRFQTFSLKIKYIYLRVWTYFSSFQCVPEKKVKKIMVRLCILHQEHVGDNFTLFKKSEVVFDILS